ncbi:NUDIX domain protein [uncultured archaeon]|nr:NUDIX domain protein [uncultured archaeon]
MENYDKKLKEIDEQLVGLVEQKFELMRREGKMENPKFFDSLSKEAQEKFSKKVVSGILDSLFVEFKSRVNKYGVKNIVASGPVIIEDGKLLVNKDSKDDFYKLPGGSVEEFEESLEEACHRETREENNAHIEIIKPLHPLLIWKNPQTGEKMAILLIHYLARVLNKDEIRPILPVKEVRWLDISEIKAGKHNVAPNIKFLIEKGDIN